MKEKKINNRIKMGVKQCQIYIFALHFDYHYISLRLFAHSPMRVWLLRCACVTAVCAADITCSIICGWSVFWSSLSLVEERTKETTTANKWKEEVNLAFETENCFFFLRDFPLRFDGSSIVYVITAELWPLWISNTEAPNVKHKRFRVC